MEARQPFANVDVLWCADAPHSHAIEQASVDYHVPFVELWTAWSAILVGHLFQCRAHTPRAALAILYRPCALATYTANLLIKTVVYNHTLLKNRFLSCCYTVYTSLDPT